MAERTIQFLDHNGPATWMERRQVSVPWCDEHDVPMADPPSAYCWIGGDANFRTPPCRLESPVQHWVDVKGEQRCVNTPPPTKD